MHYGQLLTIMYNILLIIKNRDRASPAGPTRSLKFISIKFTFYRLYERQFRQKRQQTLNTTFRTPEQVHLKLVSARK